MFRRIKMKEGDLVKWIGFCTTGAKPELKYGLILRKYTYLSAVQRVDVLWWDRSIGSRLYEDTLEVVSEGR